MEWLNILKSRLRGLVRRDTVIDEIEAELRTHLEMETDANIARGMSPEKARQAALESFGNPGRARELSYDVRGGGMAETIWQDLRFGFRLLRKHPSFTVIAVLTLALGMGANTAIFSVVNGVLLRPMPYSNPDELVAIYRTAGGDLPSPVSPPAYLNLRRNNTVFADMAALSNIGWPANFTGEGNPERLQGFRVSANLFSLLGVPPQLGRSFRDEEDRPGENRVVMLSHELWQRRFGGDPRVVNRMLTLNGEPYIVVGVMPADFRYLAKTDLWTPLALTAEEVNDTGGYLELIGRLKRGVTIEQASAEVDAITRAFVNNPNSEIRMKLGVPQTMLTRRVRPVLLLLTAAVGFVLLIACANIANLLLVRGNARLKEMAVRAALGAGRRRVARQLLVESLLLALLGGTVGLLLANWGIKFLASGLPEYLTDANARAASLRLDTAALGFTFALSLVTSLLFGLVPALRLSRINLNEVLKEGARTVGQRDRLRSTLVVAEMALAMVLLVGGGLMIKSFWRLSQVDLGYEPSGVLTAQIDPSGPTYEEFAAVTTFYQSLLERVRSVPGVRDAAFVNSLNADLGFTVDEHPQVPPERRPGAQLNQVSADYFRTMGIPLRAGRFFTEGDRKGTQPVIIIDEMLARRYFPGEDPIGKHISGEFSRGAGSSSREIVGVVGAARYWSVSNDAVPHMYVAYLQEHWWSMSLVVRARSGDPLALEGPIRAEMAMIDKNQPIHSFSPLEARVADLVAPQRYTTLLLTAFAVLAAALAAIGIYGMMSYAVAQRTREIGVRMALGASTGAVLREVMRQGVGLVAAGVSIGLVASLALSRLITDLLFGVEPTDLETLTAITLLLGTVALVASYIPARRATKVDPASALRYE